MRQTDESFLEHFNSLAISNAVRKAVPDFGSYTTEQEIEYLCEIAIFTGNMFLDEDLKVLLCVRLNRYVKYFGAASVFPALED